MASSERSSLTHSISVYIQCKSKKKMPVSVSGGAKCVTWAMELKIPSDLPHCVFKYEGKTKKKKTVSSTKWHKRKENPSPARPDVAAPQNRHLKMRLIQPLPLRAARRKNSRKTIMHRCNQGRFKEKEKKKQLNSTKKKCYLFYTFSVCSYWKNNPRRLWFVFLQTFLLSWPQIWLLLFLF